MHININNHNLEKSYPIQPYDMSKNIISRVLKNSPRCYNFRVYGVFGIDEAESMIREIQSFEVLMGARGGVAVDLVSLASTLSQVSVFASENADDMLSLDINPFMALPNGGVALDALIVAKD